MLDNPFPGKGSKYGIPKKGELVLKNKQKPSALASLVHDTFVGMVHSKFFPCVGAQNSMVNENYRFCFYDEISIGDKEAAEATCYDLFEFVNEKKMIDTNFFTFIACFEKPLIQNEQHFAKLLWRHLGGMHKLDKKHYVWDPLVSNNADDPNFAFSFAEQAFFVPGLHSHHSSRARRFTYPTLIFNLHDQFKELRKLGVFQKLQKIIHQRLMTLQSGWVSPFLADYGDTSEADQYPLAKKSYINFCPFHKKNQAKNPKI